MKPLRYALCDVFTDRPLTGNALAVFTDARGLSDETMQALAREMNLSATVFVQGPRKDGHAWIRIFTPTREVPFAGHPVLGTAFVLGGPLQTSLVRLETGAGTIEVALDREGARVVFGWMSQPMPKLESFAEAAALLAALGLPASSLPIECYDLGPRHVFVAVPTRQQVAQLRPDRGALMRLPEVGINVFCAEGPRAKTRMFAPRYGVDEDAATGSAAGPLALHLHRHGQLAAGQELTIEQGAEIGRPSTLYARVEAPAGSVTRIEVGGSALIVGRGEFTAPLRGLGGP